MNKIFKVIWSKSRNCYVVASELAKGHTKAASTGDKTKRLALAAITALMLLPVGGFSYATINSATINGTSVITGTQKDADNISGTVMKATNNARDIGDLKTAMQSVETELAQHQSVIDNLGTDKLTLSSDNTLQKESYDSTTKTTTTTDATGLKVAGPISAESGKITKSLEVGHNANVGGAVNAGSVNSRGSLNVNGNALVKGTLTSQSTINGNEIVSQTNITAKNKVVGMHGVVDNTLTSGNYVTAGNTVGENIVALDTQVKANADAIGEEARKRKYSVTNLENADKQLQTNIDNEAAERKAADTVLDDKITAETAGRVAADAKLVEATNGGLSLGDGNVLQTNTTSIDAQGNVTTSKTDANEMILNNKDNQITMNDKGIKVGTNSTVVDENGVYTGGDDYAAAKAAMKSDGSIKGADGKFTVDGTTGDVSTKGSLTAASGTIGNVSMSADGTMTGVKDLTASGKITADSFTDGTATMSNGSLNGVNQINATGNIVTTGNMQAHDMTATGTITGQNINGTTGTFGSLTTTGNASVGGTLTTNGITNTGNATTDTLTVNHNATVGGNLGVTGDITGKSLNVGTGNISGGQITGTGLDVGAGTIKTTGATETGTLKTTGKAEIGGDLSVAGNTEMKGNLDVKGDLSVEGEFNAKTLSSKLDENNYTTITGGKTQSVNLKMDKATSETKASASTFDETGSNMWAKDDDSIGKSTVTADGISQKLSDTGDNPTAYAESTMSQGTDNKYTMTDTVKDGDKTNVASQSAAESINVITEGTGDSAKTSTFNQRVDEILNQINSSDTVFSKIDQKVDNITSKVTDGTNKTSVEQGTTDITTTASNGTISNIADKVLNQGTTSVTSQIGNGSAIKSVMNADGIANTATGKSITNDAADITNTGTNSVTNQVGSNKVVVDTTGVKSAYGDNTYTIWNADGITNSTDGKMTTTVGGDMSTTVTGKVTEDYKSDLDTKVDGNETHYVAGNQTNTISGSKTESVKGAVTETYGSQSTTVNGNQSNTVKGTLTETVTGDVTEDYKANLSTTVGGKQTTTVTGDSSLTAENITNTAKQGTITNNAKDITNTAAEKLSNSAKYIENKASNSILNQVGENTSWNMTDGTVLESIKGADGQTNTITDTADSTVQNVKNGSNELTSTTSSTNADLTITNGSSAYTKVNTATGNKETVKEGETLASTNLTKDGFNVYAKDENGHNTIINNASGTTQTIQTDDEHLNETTKTVGSSEEKLTSGNSVIDVLKSFDDKGNPAATSSVTDGTNTTSVAQTAKDVTNTAKNGTITNDAKDLVNNASDSITDKVGENTTWKMTDGKISESIVNGTASNKENTTVDGTKRIITSAEGTGTYNQTATSNNISMKNAAGDTSFTKAESLEGEKTSVTNPDGSSTINQSAGSIVNFVKNKDGNTTRTEQSATDITNSAKSGTITNDAKDLVNTASEKITSQIGDGSAVKNEMTADGITNTAEGGTIYNKSKDILNEASGDILNFADGEIGNVATKITNITGDTTVTSDTNGTTFENTAHNTALTEMTKHESGDFTKTTISGNTLTTGQATMDYAEVMKDLGVHGNATVDGDTSVGGNLSVTGTSTLTGDVTMKSNATVEKDLTVKGTTTTEKLVVNKGAMVTGGTTTDTLHVTSTSTFDGAATFKGIVTMEKDLSVGGSATVTGSMTASSYKVGDKTYIDSNGINANDQKVVNVAPGRIAADSTDAINGSQLYQTNERVTGVENKVNKLDSRVDKVGANAAALANLHPLEFDADSKWNIAAAVGGYKGETATAIGAFYRPNENVMVNVSSSFGTGENMYGGGISLRIGQGGNKARRNATNGLTDREKAMQKQIDSLTNRLDALLSVINPNMSKDFPDVPENHWAYEAVSKLAGNGVIQGYEDGKYHGDRTMTRYEMAEIIYNALSKGAKAEKKLVEEFKPELQAMAAQKKA